MDESKTRAERIARKVRKKQKMVRVAMGQEKADLVLKNATYVNVFSNELCQGDIAVVGGRVVGELPLPVAGLFTDSPLGEVNDRLEHCKLEAYRRGVKEGIDPFMTLSFTSLPVIPSLRLTTLGMFDVDRMQLIG